MTSGRENQLDKKCGEERARGGPVAGTSSQPKNQALLQLRYMWARNNLRSVGCSIQLTINNTGHVTWMLLMVQCHTREFRDGMTEEAKEIDSPSKAQAAVV